MTIEGLYPDDHSNHGLHPKKRGNITLFSYLKGLSSLVMELLLTKNLYRLTLALMVSGPVVFLRALWQNVWSKSTSTCYHDTIGQPYVWNATLLSEICLPAYLPTYLHYFPHRNLP